MSPVNFLSGIASANLKPVQISSENAKPADVLSQIRGGFSSLKKAPEKIDTGDVIDGSGGSITKTLVQKASSGNFARFFNHDEENEELNKSSGNSSNDDDWGDSSTDTDKVSGDDSNIEVEAEEFQVDYDRLAGNFTQSEDFKVSVQKIVDTIMEGKVVKSDDFKEVIEKHEIMIDDDLATKGVTEDNDEHDIQAGKDKLALDIEGSLYKALTAALNLAAREKLTTELKLTSPEESDVENALGKMNITNELTIQGQQTAEHFLDILLDSSKAAGHFDDNLLKEILQEHQAINYDLASKLVPVDASESGGVDWRADLNSAVVGKRVQMNLNDSSSDTEEDDDYWDEIDVSRGTQLEMKKAVDLKDGDAKKDDDSSKNDSSAEQDNNNHNDSTDSHTEEHEAVDHSQSYFSVANVKNILSGFIGGIANKIMSQDDIEPTIKQPDDTKMDNTTPIVADIFGETHSSVDNISNHIPDAPPIEDFHG